MQRETDLPIISLLGERYSPRSFLDSPVGKDDFQTIIEAGRWAPSCFNEQPWACVYAHRENREGFERIVQTLTPRNQRWAGHASVLMITAARRKFSRAARENRHHMHDAGLMLMSMLVQGVSMGIAGHPMAGFSSESAHELLGIPDEYEAVAAVAWGYPGTVDDAPEEFREQEAHRTPRRSRVEFAFPGRWRGEDA